MFAVEEIEGNKYLSGTIYTARDAAHKRIKELVDNGLQLPLNLNGSAIYFAGPAAAPKGCVVGSIGPTTSARMDAYTETMLKLGVKAFIGKGQRCENSERLTREYNAKYYITIGGAGAYLAQCVKACQVVAFHDLGTEAIHELLVEKFPVFEI